MTGSPKQVEWAKKIREAAVAEMAELAEALIEAGSDDAAAAALAIASAISTATDSRWFIDKRDDFSIKASHPAQLANGMGWKQFRIGCILSNPACTGKNAIMRGLGMTAEGRAIHAALRELGEDQQ